MEQSLDISWKTITKVVLAGLVFYMLFLSREVVIWFFFALVISILLEPAVNFFRWMRLPKVFSVTLVYLLIFGALGLIVWLTAPIFIFEINQFSRHIPEYFETLSPMLQGLGVNVAQNFQDFTAHLVENLQNSSSSVFKALSVFFGGLSSTMVIFTFAFFISLEERGIEKVLSLLVPQKYEAYALNLFETAQRKVSGWFGARLLACIFVGLASFVVFFLLGVQYPFVLALLSGVMNFIPYIGPTITLIFSVLFAGVSGSWLVGVYTLFALLIVQEIENKVLTPVLMKKFINLPPVLVLAALLVGGTLFGFLGSIFAVPVFGIAYELIKEFLEKRKAEQVTSF